MRRAMFQAFGAGIASSRRRSGSHALIEAIRLGVEIEKNSMPHDGDYQRTNVFISDVVAAVHQGAGFAAENEELRGADAGAEVDVFLDEVERTAAAGRRAGIAHQINGVTGHRFGDGRHADELLEVENVSGVGDGLRTLGRLCVVVVRSTTVSSSSAER